MKNKHTRIEYIESVIKRYQEVITRHTDEIEKLEQEIQRVKDLKP